MTNDGATILSLLDVEHPAGKILVDLARQQDREVGDGTTSVVLIAAELLRRGNELMKNRIHPTTIILSRPLGPNELRTTFAIACVARTKVVVSGLVRWSSVDGGVPRWPRRGDDVPF